MSAVNPSLLAQKIASTNSGAESFPGLSEFGDAISKALGSGVGALLQHPVTATISSNGVTSLKGEFQDSAAHGIYYWVLDDAGTEAMLVNITPSFSAVTTERLLGGDLVAPSQDQVSTNLDFQMSESLVTVITAALNIICQKQSEGQKRIELMGQRGVRTPKEVVGDLNISAINKMVVDFQFHEFQAPKAITLYFPISFIEQIGLAHQQTAPKAIVNQNTPWSDKFRQHVLNSELPLTAVLDYISTTVGELSRLQVGQIIDLHPNALRSLEVTVMTDTGPTNLAHGRLGSYQNNKAIKLTTRIDQDFISGL